MLCTQVGATAMLCAERGAMQHNAAILLHRQGDEFRSAPVANKLSDGGFGGNR